MWIGPTKHDYRMLRFPQIYQYVNYSVTPWPFFPRETRSRVWVSLYHLTWTGTTPSWPSSRNPSSTTWWDRYVMHWPRPGYYQGYGWKRCPTVTVCWHRHFTLQLALRRLVRSVALKSLEPEEWLTCTWASVCFLQFDGFYKYKFCNYNGKLWIMVYFLSEVN